MAQQGLQEYFLSGSSGTIFACYKLLNIQSAFLNNSIFSELSFSTLRRTISTVTCRLVSALSISSKISKVIRGHSLRLEILTALAVFLAGQGAQVEFWGKQLDRGIRVVKVIGKLVNLCLVAESIRAVLGVWKRGRK